MPEQEETLVEKGMRNVEKGHLGPGTQAEALGTVNALRPERFCRTVDAAPKALVILLSEQPPP